MKNSNWISFGLSLSLSVCAASPFLAAKAFADDANLMSGPVIEVGVGNDSRSGTISKGGSGIQGQAIFRSGVAEGSLGIGGSTANSGGANHEHLNLTVPWSKDGIMGKSGLYVVSETNMTSTPFRSTITPLSIGVGGLTSDRSTRVIATVSPWNSEQLAPDAYLLGKTTSQSAHLNLEHNFGNVIVLSGDVLAGTFSKMHSRVQTSADAGTTTGSQPLTEYFPGFEQVGSGNYKEFSLEAKYRLGQNAYVALEGVRTDYSFKANMTHLDGTVDPVIPIGDHSTQIWLKAGVALGN